MPTCRKCGYVVIGSRRACEKCGSPLGEPAGRSDPAGARAVAETPRKASGSTAPPPDPATTRRSVGVGTVAAAPVSQKAARWIRLTLLVALLAAGGIYAWRVYSDGASIPFGEGNTWTFAVNGDPAHRILLHVGAAVTVEGLEGRGVECLEEENNQARLLGKGWVALRTFGLDLLAIEGMMGQHPVDARLLPFPYGPRSGWRSKLGSDLLDSGWRAEFMAAPAWESVQVPAGQWSALRVSFQVQSKQGAAAASGEYWVARGVGPVRVRLAESGSYTRAMTLELLSRQ